jgi:hypothetical protein
MVWKEKAYLTGMVCKFKEEGRGRRGVISRKREREKNERKKKGKKRRKERKALEKKRKEREKKDG